MIYKGYEIEEADRLCFYQACSLNDCDAEIIYNKTIEELIEDIDELGFNTYKKEWNSINLIGKVKERYKQIFRPNRRWDVWRGFYNGWLEGRADMLKDIRDNSNIIAFEYHNHKTGHCYVDYINREGMNEKDGYTKTPLHRV